MPTAIIYCAENLISGKKYVGVTHRTLEIRKAEHYCTTRTRYNHKFANALNYYPPESWSWYVMAKVDSEKAEEYEMFFIADLDTYKNGYNSSSGGYIVVPNYNPEICRVYHPEFGVVSGTRYELSIKYPILKSLRHLISGSKDYLGEWVLAENINKYDELLSRRTNKGNTATLTHDKYGTHTLLQSEFVTNFNLTKSGLSRLIRGKSLTHKGWRLVDATKTKN